MTLFALMVVNNWFIIMVSASVSLGHSKCKRGKQPGGRGRGSYGSYNTDFSHLQEGFASQVEQDWLARIYFLSFNITSMLIFEVVISFIVEAFVFKMLARQRSRVCPTHNKPYCQCKCAKCKTCNHKVIGRSFGIYHTWMCIYP